MIGMAKTYTREYFQRMGRKGARRVDPEKRKAAAKLRAQNKLRELCAEAGFDYDTLPADETGKKLLPVAVKDKYILWRYGWKPGKRKKTTNHRNRRKIKSK